MRSTRTTLLILLTAVVGAVAILAEPLSGANQLLCASTNLGVCVDTGDCETGPAWTLGVPEFIEIDLTKKTLSATEASGRNRVSQAANMVRQNGAIVLQGFENGRAYSIAIEESTGRMTAAVARDWLGVVVFGQCTPLRK
jgi:hypothetical protein